MKEKDFLEFAKIMGKLKRTPRTGWKMRKVKNPESVADHIFRTTLLGMLLSDLEKLNTEKIIRMLLLHDIQESLTRDISSIKKEKDIKKFKKIEENAMKKVLLILPKEIRRKYFSLWKEKEKGKTKEAKLCEDIDRLEMMIQALEYEKEQPNKKKNLEVYWLKENLDKPKNYPLLIKLYEKLKKERGTK
jgi:putative hydrolase of HD superfamily